MGYVVEGGHEHIVHDLNEEVAWSKSDCLSLNINKCLVLHYNYYLQPKPCSNYFSKGVLRSSSHICSDLRITRTDNDHYREHIATIYGKASRHVG